MWLSWESVRLLKPEKVKQDLVSGKHELIIVGAGPAGAMAAYWAASRGVDVTILDRAPVKRAKPCAGGLSTKALALLPFSVADIVERSTSHIIVGLGNNTGVALTAEGIICGFVVREDFDRHLLNHALKAGARLRRIEELRGLTLDPEQVQLEINGGEVLSTQYVIAADGANSRMRRLAVPHGAFSRGFALEGTISRSKLSFAPGMELNFGCPRLGYGWVFPKADHVNVGLYTSQETVRLSKDMLRDFASSKLGTDQVESIVGFPLGFGGASYRQTEERLLFAGDAAGMVEPLLGEGIYNAIRSGELAGLAVANALRQQRPARESYNASMRPLRRDLRRGEWVSKLFYRYLEEIGFKVLQNRVISAGLIRGYAAGRTFHQIIDRFALMPWQKPLQSDRIKELDSRDDSGCLPD
ncbi:NAD(P)/FAD-dependent oxidoreductase [Nioella aestuarii]|uniref:NAD(P)/FAD-dependent oxidoreductase n=1 Tax=Nioella aestuarii TaxID=1662864 RepID=UPI003D7F2D3A